jgi:two-component system LytT family response regulator
MPLRAVIADDEPPARRRLRRLLREIGGVDVVAEAGDSDATRAAVRELRPDVVLLDIQMPGQSGVDLVAQLDPPRPHIIFVTAHDVHAVRAFELHALDYVLKPVSRARLADAIDRLRRMPPRDPGDGRLDAWREWTSRLTPLSRLPVTHAGRVLLVDVAAIDWIESADNYVILHCSGRQYILRETLTRLIERLDADRFARIHRSTVVQIDRIDRLEPIARGDWTVGLRDGTRLTMSRTYRREILARLTLTRS